MDRERWGKEKGKKEEGKRGISTAEKTIATVLSQSDGDKKSLEVSERKDIRKETERNNRNRQDVPQGLFNQGALTTASSFTFAQAAVDLLPFRV